MKRLFLSLVLTFAGIAGAAPADIPRGVASGAIVMVYEAENFTVTLTGQPCEEADLMEKLQSQIPSDKVFAGIAKDANGSHKACWLVVSPTHVLIADAAGDMGVIPAQSLKMRRRM